jgi:hypothetical protein
MEKNIYNEDEIELINILDFIIKNCEQQRLLEDGKDKGAEFMLENARKVKDDIVEIANGRHEYAETIKEILDKRMENLHHEFCLHCGLKGEFKPIGIQKGEKGYRFYTFKCSRCRRNFRSFMPIDDRDRLEWFEKFIAELSKKDKNGRFTTKKYSVNQEKLDSIIFQYEKLKKEVEFREQNAANFKEFYDKRSQIMKINIESFGEIKRKMIAGEKMSILVYDPKHEEGDKEPPTNSPDIN